MASNITDFWVGLFSTYVQHLEYHCLVPKAFATIQFFCLLKVYRKQSAASLYQLVQLDSVVVPVQTHDKYKVFSHVFQCMHASCKCDPGEEKCDNAVFWFIHLVWDFRVYYRVFIHLVMNSSGYWATLHACSLYMLDLVLWTSTWNGLCKLHITDLSVCMPFCCTSNSRLHAWQTSKASLYVYPEFLPWDVAVVKGLGMEGI